MCVCEKDVERVIGWSLQIGKTFHLQQDLFISRQVISITANIHYESFNTQFLVSIMLLLELLLFCISITNKFKLSDIFKIINCLYIVEQIIRNVIIY